MYIYDKYFFFTRISQKLHTCVSCAGVEQRVSICDKLELSIQTGQKGAAQGHVRLAITPDLYPLHFCCHIKCAQRCWKVQLQRKIKT